MPRFVVHVQIERVYAWNPYKAELPIGVNRDNPTAPNLFPTDWAVQFGEQFLVDEGNPAQQPQIPSRKMTAWRPMAILAKSDDEAHHLALECASQWRDDVPAMHDNFHWNARNQVVSIISSRREAAMPRQKQAFDVSYAKLLAPDVGHRELEIDQLYELFRWMVATSQNYKDTQRSPAWSAQKLLNGKNCEYHSNVGMITSTQDLRERIQAAVLSLGSDLYDIWREDHGIAYGAKSTIKVPHYGSSCRAMSSIHNGLSLPNAIEAAMKDLKGHHFSMSPNHIHKDATLIQKFGICVTPDGFTFRIKFGIDDEPCASSWSHDIAITRGNEPFYETAERAMSMIHALVPTYRDRWKNNNGWRNAA